MLIRDDNQARGHVCFSGLVPKDATNIVARQVATMSVWVLGFTAMSMCPSAHLHFDPYTCA